MNSTTNITLKVPFSEKDQAKSLGAKWNAEAKYWYVPAGIDAAPFEKWLTSSQNLASNSSTSKPIKLANANINLQDMPNEDDLDAINAKLRDAYERLDNESF